MEKDLLVFVFLKTARDLHNDARELFSGTGIHHGQIMLVNLLRRNEGLTVSEIAEKRQCEKATISKMVRRMEKAGFLVSRNDLRDRRMTRVYLTRKGKDVGKKIDETSRIFNDRFCSELSQEDQNTLRTFLEKIRKRRDSGEGV